ncbi:MAG TPA: DUF3888 domain-containing protein [Bacillales bacterium]|nr:DUF3888 domain-containing protein [Bacillales bacterium]
MRKPANFLVSVIFPFIFTIAFPYDDQVPREKLLEETLISSYLPVLNQVLDQPFMCEHITAIERVGGSNRKHELTIEVVTFKGAHNPPSDLVIIHLVDTPLGGIKVMKVNQRKNLPHEEIITLCKK